MPDALIGKDMDWNWFYSTLAQSSAALVGVLSAYTFARLTAHRVSASSTRTQLHDYVARSTRHRAIANAQPFERAGNARLQFALRRLASTRWREFNNPDLDDGYSLYFGDPDLFSCFLPVHVSTSAVATMLRAFKEYTQDGGLPKEFAGTLPMPDERLAHDSPRNLEEFATQVEQHVNSARAIADELVDFHLERKAIRWLNLVCLCLFVTGVALPLLYLPQPERESAHIAFLLDNRLTLVMVVSLVFVAFLAYLARMEIRTSMGRMDVETFCESTRLEWYHNALRAYEETRIRPDQYRSYILESTEESVARALRLATATNRNPLVNCWYMLRRLFPPHKSTQRADA